MDLRKILSRWLLRPEMERLSALTREVANDWRMVPYLAQRSPEALIEQLAEFDSRLADLLTRRIQDYSFGMDTSENFRLQIVRESRSLYLTDPVTQFAVELWTDYAFGNTPNLTAEDKTAQELWEEFWTADRNAPVLGDRKLHKQSETLLVDGEIFFVIFVSTLDGLSTVRTIPTDQIKEVVKDPADASINLYYRRDSVTANGNFETVYYPDWSASPEALSRAKLPPDAKKANETSLDSWTDVVVMQAAFREVGGRGWPLMTAGIDWSREYKQFLTNRAAVARAAASAVEKIKVKGGQRAVDMMKSRIGSTLGNANDAFDTNPPPPAGSAWLENDAVDRQWMNRPTNSADAEKDGMALLTQLGLAAKLYPHYLGRGDTYRLATSTAMEGPTLKSFNRYQAFWSSVWRDLFCIVAMMAERHGGKSFQSLESTISTDRIITMSQEDIKAASDMVYDMIDRGLLDDEAGQEIIKSLLRVVFETLGLHGFDELLKLIKPPEENPMPPPIVPPVPPDPNAPPEPEPTEAGESQPPFSLVEAKATVGQYRSALRSIVRGLWTGALSRTDFTGAMKTAIESGLHGAWAEGMDALGIGAEDFTQEEENALTQAVLDEYRHIAGFADAIEAGSKANGGKLAALQGRIELWANRWNQLRSRALLMAGSNPPLRWQYGDTDHCDDCVYANGKVYRASTWAKYGWETQSPDLACHGYNCKCSLIPVPKGTRLTRGHPRRPGG